MSRVGRASRIARVGLGFLFFVIAVAVIGGRQADIPIARSGHAARQRIDSVKTSLIASIHAQQRLPSGRTFP